MDCNSGSKLFGVHGGSRVEKGSRLGDNDRALAPQSCSWQAVDLATRCHACLSNQHVYHAHGQLRRLKF